MAFLIRCRRITSPFGMRFHPVLRYWKLHDGTDFGAGCGTQSGLPRGRVAERYYNAGYGKRLMIDHGYIGGGMSPRATTTPVGTQFVWVSVSGRVRSSVMSAPRDSPPAAIST